jgi:hypothetical protein
MSKNPNEYALEEYKDVSINMRQYGTMRFAQLTLFVAASGALLLAALKPLGEVSGGRRNAVRIGGLILTVIFWILEERSTAYWVLYRERAKYLEKTLGFEQYQRRPNPMRIVFEINATNAMRLLFVSSIIFWILHWTKAW